MAPAPEKSDSPASVATDEEEGRSVEVANVGAPTAIATQDVIV